MEKIQTEKTETVQQCPIDHEALSLRRMPHTNGDQPSVLQDDKGVWHIHSYDIAKKIMRGQKTRQAGFGSEMVRELPGNIMQKEPVLYQDGPEHKTQRRELARFFTPKTTSTQYRDLMEQYADEMVTQLKAKRQAELSELSMSIAVGVAAEVVGLTNSLLPGMAKRIDAFVQHGSLDEMMDVSDRSPKAVLSHIRNQLKVAKFLFLDVKPAIRQHRRQPKEDIISHLLEQEYNDLEIMVECITYGTAGMVTTREFIVFATWHFLENEPLRQRFLAAEETERHQILEEILRVEPIISNILRRTTEPIEINDEVTIPANALIDLNIISINADETAVGENPDAVCPMRDLPRGMQPPMMSFGDGHHRCPGAYIAIQESDIFLQKLLAIPTLRLVSEPVIGFKEVIQGYETRNFVVAVD